MYAIQGRECGAGKLVYHGPREDIIPFFEQQGMHCPERKADSDFLQEVTSRKDQQVTHTTTRMYAHLHSPRRGYCFGSMLS